MSKHVSSNDAFLDCFPGKIAVIYQRNAPVILLTGPQVCLQYQGQGRSTLQDFMVLFPPITLSLWYI